MVHLEPWKRRPIEEANLFNPAFLCALTYEFVSDYEKTHSTGAPLTLVIISLTTSLHRLSRERLPHSTVTSMYSWIQENEDLLVGFAIRAKNITPYIKEAVLFGMALNTLAIREAHSVQVGAVKAGLPKGFISETTPETKAIIDRTKFLGRWFAKSGSEISISAAWGVKP